MASTIAEALEAHRTDRGGPQVREGLAIIDRMNDYSVNDRTMNEAFKHIVKGYKGVPDFDPTPVIEFAYQQMRAHPSFFVGVHTLKQARDKLGVELDNETILDSAYGSVPNYGDKGVRLVAEKLGFRPDGAAVAENAYARTGENGLAFRAMNALCYAHQLGADLDPSRINVGVLESDIAREIKLKGESVLGEVRTQLATLREYGIDLAPDVQN